MGARRDALAEGVRAIRYKGYAVFYTATGPDVVVAAIVHEKRDINAEDVARYFDQA